MPNQIPLQDDIQFWGQQVTEHAMFMGMMLEDPQLQNEAVMMQGAWEQVLATQNPNQIVEMLNYTIPWKQNILARLKSGEWLGWALPSFVEHITFEEQYFLARLTSGTTAKSDLDAFTKIVKEHAMVAPKLLDISQPDAIAKADSVVNVMTALQTTCAGFTPNCVQSAQQSFAYADMFFQRDVPTTLNIIPPALAAHIVREGQRGLLISNLL